MREIYNLSLRNTKSVVYYVLLTKIQHIRCKYFFNIRLIKNKNILQTYKNSFSTFIQNLNPNYVTGFCDG